MPAKYTVAPSFLIGIDIITVARAYCMSKFHKLLSGNSFGDEY